ncbi:MAG: hypothetical protein PHY16_14440 [Methylobacter sp.]|nr:hypothetical protein [Methylobacter sp.]
MNFMALMQLFIGEQRSTAGKIILKSAVEHFKTPFALSLLKGEQGFGMLTQWVSVRKPFMLRPGSPEHSRRAQHERLSHVPTAVFRIIHREHRLSVNLKLISPAGLGRKADED